MTDSQQMKIQLLIAVSIVSLALPAIVGLIVKIHRWIHGRRDHRPGISKIVKISFFVLVSLWCLRYAVGCYELAIADVDQYNYIYIQEIFLSLIHTMQTFSLDAPYSEFVDGFKEMMGYLLGDVKNLKLWLAVCGAYVSALSFVAPALGSALFFEILANVFPKVKMFFCYLFVWKEKYYFSELNASSLAIAKSIRETKSWWRGLAIFRPTLIFTDVYTRNENEKESELLLEAKSLGAICLRDDLSHVKKNYFGRKRKFFLIDNNQSGSLRALANLVNQKNKHYLMRAEIYLFCQDDAYVQIEKRMCDKMKQVLKIPEKKLPAFIPIHNYRNLISNLLVEVPLYEPLIHKATEEDGTVSLDVTILGAGSIGIEMFLTTYWIGQILDCKLTIRVVSRLSEEEFWNKIDCINPEIRHTMKEGDSLLKINDDRAFASPYCTVFYTMCDVKTSEFVELFDVSAQDKSFLNSDYFFVALGSDADNLSVANMLKNHIGEYHVLKAPERRCIITYVVYDSDLTTILNRTRMLSFVPGKTDIYMQAIGSLQEVFSTQNIFMTEHRSLAEEVHATYLFRQNKQDRVRADRKRKQDNYRYWADLAQAMHTKYRVFSLRLFQKSLFDFPALDSPGYLLSLEEAFEAYEQTVTGSEKLHKMAWLEHRRWNAFMRVTGFRCPDDYTGYAVEGKMGSYKQMELKLHPCIVECDQLGIREKDDAGNLKPCEGRPFDRLDQLSQDMLGKYNNYDFKKYDYPHCAFGVQDPDEKQKEENKRARKKRLREVRKKENARKRRKNRLERQIRREQKRTEPKMRKQQKTEQKRKERKSA